MIKWITDRLGTSAKIDAVEHPNIHIVDVRDMVDKLGNSIDEVKKKIEEVINPLNQGKRVVICCDYGMSRSNAIAAGALAKISHISFNEAVGKVMSATSEKAIKIEVLSVIRKALENAVPDNTNNNPFLKKSIFMTGRSGFIGTSLLPYLQTCHKIFAPEREKLDLIKGPVELDLMVKEEGIDTIVHLANPRIYTSHEAMGETLLLLKNVLDVCRENKVKLIYPSSWEVYSGYRSKYLLAAESLPSFPKGTYGETKYLCETLIKQYQQLYGIDYVILRFSPIYGLGSDRPKFIYNFLEKAIHNAEITTHKYMNGFPTLDLLYIDDAISALVKVIETNYIGFLNFGTSTGTSTTEVAQLIIKELGSKSIVKHREIEDFAPNIVMDTTRARTEIGWQPKIRIEEGLQQIISGFCRKYKRGYLNGK
ncbi:MAG: NAD-dependent epimerase/dehydratase family protein [bacterium]